MAAETFFGRWSRRKAEVKAEVAHAEAASPAAPPVVEVPVPVEAEAPLPTLAQVAELQKDADFRPFVARGVDEGVRRAAMKKLFTDPHFNVMDGLDIYIDDYSKSDPIPAAMLLAMNHAKDLLDPLGTIARENAKRGLLTAADMPSWPESVEPQAAAEAEEHHEVVPGQGAPESAIAPTAPVAPEPAAAPSLIDTIDPADRQEDHEQPNQSM